MAFRNPLLLLLLVFTLAAPNTAVAGDPAVREIQRLLWSLEYGATRLDGIMSADTSARIQKFLADRSKTALSGNEQITGELNAAYGEARAKAISSSNEVVDRGRLLSSNSSGQRMAVSPSNDLVLAGSCPINRVRLSDSAPLKPFRICGISFVVSEALHLIVSNAHWANDIDGLLLVDRDSGLRVDFIEAPNADAFARIDIGPGGKDVLILTTKMDLLRVSLETRAVVNIMHGPNSVTHDARFSPDGRYYAASWAIVAGKNQFPHRLAVWERGSDRKLFEIAAQEMVFSEDGKFFALQDDKDSSTVEIRETATNNPVFKMKFNGSPDFEPNDGRVAFNRDNTGLLYVDYDGKVLRQWDFKSGEISELLKFDAAVDRVSIKPSTGKVVAIAGANVLSYSLQGGSESARTHVTSLEVKGGAVSSDQKLLLAYANDAMNIVEIASGRVRDVPVFGTKNITSAAFIPNSPDIVVGTDDGTIFAVERGNRRNVAKLDASIDVLVSAHSGALVAAQSGKKTFVLDLGSGRVVTKANASNFQASSSNMAFVDGDSRLLFLDSDSHRIIALDIQSGRQLLGQQLKSQVRRVGNQTNWMWAWIGFIAPNPGNPGSYWVAAKSFGNNILYEYSNGQLLPRKGSPEGTNNFFAAGSTVGDTFDDGALAVSLGNTPKTLFVDSDKFLSQHASLRDEALVVKALSGNRFVTLDKSGEVRIYSRSSSEPLVRTIFYAGSDWLSRTDRGFFTGTKAAAENLFLAQGVSGSVSLDSLFNALYRPDLVAEAAQGDPAGKVSAAAAQLDLEKVMASGRAPNVAITSPASGASSPNDEVAIEVTIVDQGGGVGKIEWRVNGVTLGLESRGLGRLGDPTDGSAQTLRVKRALSLEPGDNRVEVVAYNARNLIASEPALVTVKWDGSKMASPPRLYVLAVGVNDYYDGRLHLAYAVPDATALADAFRKSGAGLYAGVEVRTVLDGEVTVENLDKVFADLAARVQPRDVFVFFLAGHGKTKNGRYYFLPRDFRYEDESSIEKSGVGQDKFQGWFAEVPARKSILLYDTCESGSLTGATRGSDIDERLGALNRMARATGRTFLTATTDDAPALEGYHGHGVFTYALLDAFEHADVNNDGLIEMSELADYIDQKVPDYSFEAFKLRQIPQRSIVGNNFPLANKVDVLPDQPGAPRTVPAVVGADMKAGVVANASPGGTLARPTHVVIAPAEVYSDFADTSVKVEALVPGTMVTLVKTEQGWVLVAREGKVIGYVADSKLARVQ